MITPRRALAFMPDRNTGERHDFTGAFRPEANAFVKRHDALPAVMVNIADPLKRRTEHVIAAITASQSPLELIAFFCHGHPLGLQLVGDRAVRSGGSVQVEAHGETIRKLAAAIASRSKPDVRVVLYACSAGNGAQPDGDEGFADRLRDALCVAGARHNQVFAHTTAGHATQNPHVRVFAGNGSPVGGTGGTWIVAPSSKLWPTWKHALRNDLRFRFPLMSLADIHGELLRA
jgi:hypothetical protein